jgi:glycosyltransferase involved in cell wall biosynthesis
MRVAIVHYWFVGMRGGEKVIEQLCRIFPQADIFTHVYDRAAVSKEIAEHRVTTSFIARLPAAKRRYKSYLPLMPMALEQLDLRGYDLIISSESGPSKGIVPPPEALHICYCHSPMRYIWNMYHDYREASGLVTRMMLPPLSHYIRMWDALSASRVHHFVANSRSVSARIQTYYNRSAAVIYPPVNVEDFASVPAKEVEDYYLMVGELVPYKRAEIAVEACNRLGRKLVVIGGGERLNALRKIAGPAVSILGPQPFEQLRWHYSRCRALIFPGEEDFGIVPVEAMASGRPVIAFNRGGVTESVIEGVTGTFFQEQSAEAIADAIRRFETMHFDPPRIIEWAGKFGPKRFARDFKNFVEMKMLERSALTQRTDMLGELGGNPAAYNAMPLRDRDAPRPNETMRTVS